MILQPSIDRQELADECIQLQQNNLPQLDGPAEGTEQYVSAATFPLQWREYPLNSAGSQVANWDSTGDQLYQTQSSIADIQCRNIELGHDEPLECRDGEHCTNHLVKEPHEAPAVEVHVVQEEEVIEELDKGKAQEPPIEEEHNPKEVVPLTDQV